MLDNILVIGQIVLLATVFVAVISSTLSKAVATILGKTTEDDVSKKSPGTSKKQTRSVAAVASASAATPLDHRIDPTWDDSPVMAFSTPVVAAASAPSRPRVRAGTALQSPESIADKYANEFEAHA